MSGLTPDELTPATRCGYCLQKYAKMLDPRMLPCEHIFCLPCMKDDYSTYEGFICPTCLVHDKKVELNTLPQVIQDEGRLIRKPKHMCDRGRCEKLSITYCRTCMSRNCEDHTKAHSAFFRNHHTVITMSEYNKEQEK
ncbi:uncharacterized protein [Watersipora subatra]|uniref:uncharacterized protein n=1 Tax=Watersipora subatra TaxID=2589382 RepID=UPI00355BD2E7